MSARNDLTRHLDYSLERLKTSYIDLYLIHMLADISWMGEDIKSWAEKTKAKGKIRFFDSARTHKWKNACWEQPNWDGSMV